MVEALRSRSYCTRCKYSTARVYIINIIQVLMISTVYFKEECLMIFFEDRLFLFKQITKKKNSKIKNACERRYFFSITISSICKIKSFRFFCLPLISEITNLQICQHPLFIRIACPTLQNLP